MKFTKSIPFSILILLIFSTLMAIASTRAFLRLSPEIERINQSNTQSLYIVEQMLSAEINNDIKTFEENLLKGKNNITEPQETEKFVQIENAYKKAFMGDVQARKILISNITELSEINRVAIINYAQNAKKLSITGTWVIAFMIFIVWSIGIIILTNLRKTIIEPLDELEDVLDKVAKGNKHRRCPSTAPTKDFQKIYDGVNNLLDK